MPLSSLKLNTLSHVYKNGFLMFVPRQYSRSLSSQSDGGMGPLCDTLSTKTLFYLISTLNASFKPDYDFSYAKSEEFSREPSVEVGIMLLRHILTGLNDSNKVFGV